MRKYIVFPKIVLAIGIIVILSSCFDSKKRVTGVLVSEKSEILSDIKLVLTLYDNGKHSEMYKVNVQKNGNFEVKIRRENSSKFAWLYIETWNRSTWTDPFISSDLKPYKLDFESEEINLGNVYITDPINIIKRNQNDTVKSLEDICFEWDSFSFADFYSIAVSRRESNGDYTLYLNSHNLKEAKFDYIEAQNYELVTGNIPAMDFPKIGSFNRKSIPLKAGTYRLTIQAFVVDIQMGEIIQIGQTSDTNPFFFHIEM